MEDSCKTCRFYHHVTGLDGYGDCRRHAPVVIDTTCGSNNWSIKAMFPPTSEDNYCGDYESRRESVAGISLEKPSHPEDVAHYL